MSAGRMPDRAVTERTLTLRDEPSSNILEQLYAIYSPDMTI